MALADQKAVGSGFENRPDGADVIEDVDLAGKTAIVTGGYSGIGVETTRALAGKGARVLVPARDRAKANRNLEGIEGDVTVGSLDLSDQGSIAAFARTANDELMHLDLLINNAGIMACPETRIGPSWEAQFGTNHLGPHGA